jgi:hypothetical protein
MHLWFHAQLGQKILYGIYYVCATFTPSAQASSHPVAVIDCAICIFANQYWPSIAELYLPAVSLHCI